MLQAAQSFKRHRRQIVFSVMAGLIGYVSDAKNQDVSGEIKYFKSFTELQRLAIRKVIGESAIAGGGPCQSLPVPVRHQDQLQIAFMFCSTLVRPGPLKIWPPSKVAWINPANGNLIALTKVSPSDFGQMDSDDQPLKEKSDKYPSLAVDVFLSLEKRLFVLYDVLFEAWANKSPMANYNKLQDSAREFLKIFDQVSEKPLRPYYYSLGSDWFGWLRKLAE